MGSLTSRCSKPAVPFGGDKRIIDFTLANCIKTGITKVGILSQYFSEGLHEYVREAYSDKGFALLPPDLNGSYYVGTADAVYQNMVFIEENSPQYVLVLAGDHIYEMDYSEMVGFHIQSGAATTIASTQVPKRVASSFGILEVGEGWRIVGFEEKPPNPKTNIASMGIYVFTWSALRKYLIADSANLESSHDFGKNVLPAMMAAGEPMYAYIFDGYWRDVGTVESLWEANMVYLDKNYMTEKPRTADAVVRANPYRTADGIAVQSRTLFSDCSIYGMVEHTILSPGVTVCESAEVKNSVLMPGVHIGPGAKVNNAIIGFGAHVQNNVEIGVRGGSDFFIDEKICTGGISLVEPYLSVPSGLRMARGSHVHSGRFAQWKELDRVKE